MDGLTRKTAIVRSLASINGLAKDVQRLLDEVHYTAGDTDFDDDLSFIRVKSLSLMMLIMATSVQTLIQNTPQAKYPPLGGYPGGSSEQDDLF